MVRKQIVSKEKPVARPFPIGGSLRTHYQAWKSLTDNSWVLRSVLGHRLEWNHTPPRLSLAPLEQRMSQEKERVLDQEISYLLQKRAIEPTSDVGFFSQLFVVQKKGGGWRPIINLKRLNVYLDIKHFKMEGIYTLRDVLQRSDWMGKLDLSDAYLTVPIHPSDRKYLKFCWNGRCYQFRSLPFGLATAPRTFTKLMKPMVIQMRNRGVRLIVYLDDILILAQSTQLLRAHMKMVAQMLESLGFKLNLKKCEWEPSQCIEFLGFLVNSTAMTISLPLTKLQKVQKECRALLRRILVTPRQLAQLIGLMTASIPAVAQAPLHYRALQRLRNRALLNKRYDDEVQMDEASQLDLHWWIHQLRSHNGRPLMTPVASLIITSDASNSGWGATCQNSRTGGPWSSEERKAHINWLELKAAFLLLLIDNVTAISFINHKRRHSFEEIVRPSADDLGLVPSEEYHHLRRAHSWSGQCRSRPGIKETNWTRGMDAQQRDFQKDPQEVGPSGGGPLRSQAQSPTPEILQLQTRPWNRSDRCLSSVVEGSKTLRFPTIQSSRKMSEKDKAGASPVGSSDCSSVAGSIMVSHHVGEFGRSTSSFASLPPCIGVSSGADTSTSEEQQSQISRLESVRKSVEDRGISKEAFEILSSSWRSSTEKSYSSAWRKWMGWCHERPFQLL